MVKKIKFVHVTNYDENEYFPPKPNDIFEGDFERVKITFVIFNIISKHAINNLMSILMI